MKDPAPRVSRDLNIPSYRLQPFARHHTYGCRRWLPDGPGFNHILLLYALGRRAQVRVQLVAGE